MKQGIWLLALTLVAIVTTGAQLDRQARVSGGVAASVPAPFRGFAQERIALSALTEGDHEAALREAKRLVARRPLPAEHLRALTLAQSLAGQHSDSLATMQVAARRGWRDPFVQGSMLRLAIRNDDGEEAARRFAALVAMPQTPQAVLTEHGSFALQTPEAQSSFATILAQADRWHGNFLARGVRALPIDISTEIILEAKERGAQFNCGQLRQAQRIMNAQQPGAGATIGQAFEKIC